MSETSKPGARGLRTDDYDYDLPEELIAQHPVADRDGSRLMKVGRSDGVVAHHTFHELPSLLRVPSLLVVNDSKVFPARLRGQRESGGAAELLLLQKVGTTTDGERWRCLGRPRKRLRPGTRISFGQLSAVVAERDGEGLVVELRARGSVSRAVRATGHIPLPPYIRREDEPLDRERYQTIFARGDDGSVAAPTAGLHFTDSLLIELENAGHRLASITLHVGPGTFRPVRTDILTDHEMDGERFEVRERTAGEINRAREEGRPVIAVGTTTVRTLETLGQREGPIEPCQGTTRLFVLPGHDFRIVEGLVTNFHLPRSTLLALVGAFAGRERVLDAYRRAVQSRYRFYSYGDAMLIL